MDGTQARSRRGRRRVRARSGRHRPAGNAHPHHRDHVRDGRGRPRGRCRRHPRCAVHALDAGDVRDRRRRLRVPGAAHDRDDDGGRYRRPGARSALLLRRLWAGDRRGLPAAGPVGRALGDRHRARRLVRLVRQGPPVGRGQRPFRGPRPTPHASIGPGRAPARSERSPSAGHRSCRSSPRSA